MENFKDVFCKVFTTVLLTGLLTFNMFMLGTIRDEVLTLNNRVFSHLTNDEMHTLRSTVVTKSEFELYKIFSSENYKKISEDIRGLKTFFIDIVKNEKIREVYIK